MEGWMQKIHNQFEALNATASARIEVQRNHLSKYLTQTPCGKCGTKTLDGDLLRFYCKNDTSDKHHVLCFDCVADALERQKGFLENEDNIPKRKLQEFPILLDVVLCFECHRPYCISRSLTFDTGFEQTQLRSTGRWVYKINKDVTDELQKHYIVHTCYEKQHRGLLSKFSPLKRDPSKDQTPDAGISSSQFIGSNSQLTLTGKKGGSKQSGNSRGNRPMTLLQDQEMWLENWTCDTNEGDPQGWVYARDWPDSFMFRRGGCWSRDMSVLMFVRQRKLMRTALNLTDAFKFSNLSMSGNNQNPSSHFLGIVNSSNNHNRSQSPNPATATTASTAAPTANTTSQQQQLYLGVRSNSEEEDRRLST